VILLVGIPSEPPLALVAEAARELGLPYLVFNQRRFDGTALALEIREGEVDGWLRIEGATYPLAEISGVYVRLVEDAALPELAGEPLDSPRRRRCRGLHAALLAWLEVAPCRVVNRTSAMASNASKPFQAQLIRRAGFAIPETLITNDPEAVSAFLARHQRAVYKSVSGVRSIVRLVEPADLTRLELVRWCPVQFQAYVEGHNVRVHTVGEAVFAITIGSNAVDYRYAHRDGLQAELLPTALDDELCARCRALARTLGLEMAGIDLAFGPDGTVFCFEVNPSPGFSYFESVAGQPIARTLVLYLAGNEPGLALTATPSR
jgi:glutathione synthase/RimK-type ligase-like ATP-grasp enzyme